MKVFSSGLGFAYYFGGRNESPGGPTSRDLENMLVGNINLGPTLIFERCDFGFEWNPLFNDSRFDVASWNLGVKLKL
jgi:hypothetical protein